MEREEIIFRSARIEDAKDIVNFQLAMAKETESLSLDFETCTKGVAAVFADSRKGEYFVAANRKQILGSLLIVPEWSDWRNGQVWWIHSVFVTPEYRGKGLYAGLYRHIQGLVNANENLRGLRLYVDKRNRSAQEVYKKLGMSNEHYELFEWMKTF